MDNWLTWQSTLDEALVPLLFECIQRMHGSSRYFVEVMYTIVDCEIE